MEEGLNTRNNRVVFVYPPRCKILTSTSHSGEKIFFVGEKLLHAFLGQIVGRTVSLSGEMLKLCFEIGCELEAHRKTLFHSGYKFNRWCLSG